LKGLPPKVPSPRGGGLKSDQAGIERLGKGVRRPLRSALKSDQAGIERPTVMKLSLIPVVVKIRPSWD